MLGAEVRKNLIAPRRQARKEKYLLVSRTWRALRLCASHLLPLSSLIQSFNYLLLAFGLERNVLLTKPF
jgi:hypothetical protein